MAEERISWFPVVADADLEEPERKLFAKATEALGFVPNVFRAYAWRPERFRAWFSHFRNVMEGTPGVSAAEREMISVAVSMSKAPRNLEPAPAVALGFGSSAPHIPPGHPPLPTLTISFG